MKDDGVIRSPDTERENRVPPGQSLTSQWPVLHYGSIPKMDTAEWTFTLSGLVASGKVLSYQEFTALEQVVVFSDIHCVTRWSRLDNLWQGLSSRAVTDLVKVLSQAKFAIIHAAGGFTTNLKIDDFLQPDVVFALKHDGQPLSPEHGAPVRLVVPRLYFWKSAKWVTGVEFTADDRPGFWESAGYHNRGDPWKEERYSR
ncbi:MAG: sulfite oxidase-like oxidoreductase [Dehalococcoidales bacterium]|nr:sulfite oxidase-like oxidoreductase [Dehalococcoidales bacterium]